MVFKGWPIFTTQIGNHHGNSPTVPVYKCVLQNKLNSGHTILKFLVRDVVMLTAVQSEEVERSANPLPHTVPALWLILLPRVHPR